MRLATTASSAPVVPLDEGGARRALRHHAVDASDARRFVTVNGVSLAYWACMGRSVRAGLDRPAPYRT